MIKLFATLIMIVDHIGSVVLSDAFNSIELVRTANILRIIGRFSMPLFAYCVARGFYYSKKNGTIFKYLKNLIIFSVVSQPTAMLLTYFLKVKKEFYLNIGFVWFFSVIVLYSIESIKFPLTEKSFIPILPIVAIVLVTFIVKMEFGLYGVLFPVIFYFFAFKTYNPIVCFLASFVIYLMHCHIRDIVAIGEWSQFLAMFSVPLAFFLSTVDGKVKLPGRFYYWFYPVHLYILILIRYFLVYYKILKISS